MATTWQEDFTLPEEVLEARHYAMILEISWHIFQEFDFETRHLSDEMLDELKQNYVAINDAKLSNKEVACRAFARLINDNKNEISHLISDYKLEEWLPG